MNPNASSPSATGPAGSLFEAQIGAHYLLSLLTDREPRGLPATRVDRVAMQRAAEGNPLDDVIVFAHDSQGSPAILEIQVKRSITFAPADPIFRSVVDQVAEASRKPEFLASRYELAIAAARTSQKITGPYQDVLTWARQLGDAFTFMSRISRAGSASDDMRSFVRTFQAHLATAGAPSDDQTVWALLRRLQILVFDFAAPSSASEQLAKERCVRALHADDSSRANELWAALLELSLEIAASGGDRTRPNLVADLAKYSFRLEGNRRFFSARATLAEASQNTLADINDRVASLMLTRHERVGAVHAALDAGRYIQIRGDAGVGKSGVLKHFAEQYATEGPIIVLSPSRTVPNGWLAMRAVLGFDGTASDLLHDLASNGGAALLVDNLDFFEDAARRTVTDLVRTAAEIPGFAVITTARTNFGVEEQNWLPPEALDRLGRAEPVTIEELRDAEVEEIRYSEPALAPLLADNHPARDVTRNLFRLARLARMSSDQIPRTEAEMAMHWWETADGRHDDHHRDRSRALRALAEQALLRDSPLTVADYPAFAVDALVRSESLRDLGNDRVAFRHDVLREWAIANLLHLEPETIERLPLDKLASPALARAIELASRIAIEQADDSARWRELLERMSREGVHGSWRRAVMLALPRSEASSIILTRASDFLFADRAARLREIIRMVMAVDVQPSAPMFTAVGLDPAKLPANIHIPYGPSWYRLIGWLLNLGRDLPAAAIPDVANLFTSWSVGMLGLDALTPSLLQRFYDWLTEIETARHARHFRDCRPPFDGNFSSDRIDSLESDLRTGLLLFCNRTPALSAEYLRSVIARPHNDNIVRSILKFRGTLAQAAPAELADLTLNALIPAQESESNDDPPGSHALRGPFSFLDTEFIPASPAQGPFFELLVNAPREGVALIRSLIDHAISYYTGGRAYGSNVITIPFPDADLIFPWRQSYMWSRFSASSYCVTSGLMALEAWAHKRIEAAEPFERVLADVLGTDAPAANLLVAVDLILSHWPESREAAIPFLASPELLCLDRQRVLQDNFELPDFLGFRALEKEPSGPARLDDLKKQPSRRLSLEQLIGRYAVTEPREQRERLTEHLLRARERLGSPDAQSDLGDPRLMAVHALNLADPKNWREVATTLPDGTSGSYCEYQAPETEARHLAALQEAVHERSRQSNMLLAVGAALDNPSRSSPQFAAAAVAWAQQAEAAPTTADESAEDKTMRERAIIAAATIAIRDGDTELRARSEVWVRGAFARAAQTNEDRVVRFQSQLRFNALATAFVGIAQLLRSSGSTDDVRTLLQLAGRDNPVAAHGFGASIELLAEIDQRLPRSLLRCAFTAAIHPRHEWNVSDEMTSRAESHELSVPAAVNAELEWLANRRSEPEWPQFPIERARPRFGINLHGSVRRRDHAMDETEPEYYVDYQSAAFWLDQIGRLGNAGSHPWMVGIARAYSEWTATANGAGLEAYDEVDHPPAEWNAAYFGLVANCLPVSTTEEIDTLALQPIRCLPDEAFFDVVTIFQRSVDGIYFNSRALDEDAALHVRAALADRLTASRGWRRIGTGRLSSIETHIGPAIAVLFFNDYGLLTPAKCYLLPEAISRVELFLPMVEKLVHSGPSLFVALVTLNLMEVAPNPAHAAFLLAAAESWLERYHSETEFWVDHGIGRRICLWIEAVRRGASQLTSEGPLKARAIRLIAALVNLGVAEAKQLEEELQQI